MYQPDWGNAIPTVWPPPAAVLSLVHAKPFGSMPDCASVTSAVKVTVCPATAVVGPAILPVGLTMSGIVLSLSLTISAPFVPPIAPTLAEARSAARQSLVAQRPSTGCR